MLFLHRNRDNKKSKLFHHQLNILNENSLRLTGFDQMILLRNTLKKNSITKKITYYEKDTPTPATLPFITV